MKRFLGYILSLCKRTKTQPAVTTESKSLIDEIIDISDSLIVEGFNINVSTRERSQYDITSRATCRDLIADLHMIRRLASKTERGDKYIDILPAWFVYDNVKTNRDYFFTVNDNFVTELEVVMELNAQAKLIKELLEADYNESFRRYYLTKPTRLYKEIILVLKQL